MTRFSQTLHSTASVSDLAPFNATVGARLIQRCLAILSDNALRRLWRARRNQRALMGLCDRLREDCGLAGRGVPSATDLENLARWRLKTGFASDWR